MVALALPISAGHLGQMLMGWADTAMLGRVGTLELAACAFANTVLLVPAVFGFGLLSAVAVRTALAKGAGDPPAAARAFHGGVLLAFVTGAALVALVWLSQPLLPKLGQPEEVVHAAGSYYLLCATSLVPAFLSAASKNACEALSRPWAPFWIVMASVALNILLNWVFIFGNLGAPSLGLEGAGWATLAARVAGAGAMLALPWISPRLQYWLGPGVGLKPGAAEVGRLVGVGAPVGAMNLAEVSGFSAASLLTGWISAEALAAHQIAVTCTGTSFMAALGVSQAACVRVGQCRGAGKPDEAWLVAGTALALACAIMGVAAAAFLLAGEPLARLFTQDRKVVEIAAGLLVIAGFFQILDGVQVVSAGALRGFEDTRWPMAVGIVAYWLVALPLGWWLAFTEGWGAAGVWAGFLGALVFAAVALLGRLIWRLRRSADAPSSATLAL